MLKLSIRIIHLKLPHLESSALNLIHMVCKTDYSFSDGWKNPFKQINISIYLFISTNPVLGDNSFSDGWKNSL